MVGKQKEHARVDKSRLIYICTLCVYTYIHMYISQSQRMCRTVGGKISNELKLLVFEQALPYDFNFIVTSIVIGV
jgi:hypothetical protein